MEEVKEFIKTYRGAIIGIAVAILIILTRLSELIMAIIIIGICAFAGNYIQYNKYEVKEKIKKFIDRV